MLLGLLVRIQDAFFPRSAFSPSVAPGMLHFAIANYGLCVFAGATDLSFAESARGGYTSQGPSNSGLRRGAGAKSVVVDLGAPPCLQRCDPHAYRNRF